MLKARIGKLEARICGKDDLLAFKRIIEAIHEMDPIEGFNDGFAEKWARQACEDGYTVAKMAAALQTGAGSFNR